MKTFALPVLLSIGFALYTSSCGNDPAHEEYGFTAPSQIVLSSANHPHGYARSECFNCHVQANIHLVDHAGSGTLSLARSLVESQGLVSCSGCHGRNGVNP